MVCIFYLCTKNSPVGTPSRSASPHRCENVCPLWDTAFNEIPPRKGQKKNINSPELLSGQMQCFLNKTRDVLIPILILI